MIDHAKKTLKLTLAALALMAGINFNAQQTAEPEFHNPPMNFETLVGSRGVSFQMVIDKKIKSAQKFGFFSVTDFNSDWNNDQLSDLMVMGKATFDIVKGLKVGAGFQREYTWRNPPFCSVN